MIILFAILAGLVSTLTMDVVAIASMKLNLINLNGLQIVPPLLGRWFLTFFESGVFIHEDIRSSASQAKEIPMGLLFHYLIGATLAVIFVLAAKRLYPNSNRDALKYGVFFGLITNALPWLIMHPSLGFGFFALKLPQFGPLLVSSVINHLAYGTALGANLIWIRKRFPRKD